MSQAKWWQADSFQSTGNSSTTALSGGATFTGTGEKNFLPTVMVSCYSDVAGTLYFDFSPDGTNWSTFPSAGFAVSAGIHEFHTAVKGPRWFRARYVNGSSAQSAFRLYVYYGDFRQPSAPLNQAHGLDADAILVRPTPPWLDIARGLATGITVVKKFGRNPSVGTTFVPITRSGLYRTPQASGATALRIKAGGNANDTAAGTGARSVTLYGLDQNFALAQETIATNGASASSATTTTFTRLFRIRVASSGTYATATAGSHAGAITIENAAGTEDWGVVGVTDFPKASSEIGAYSVPSGYTAYVFRGDITIDSGKTAEMIFFYRAGANETAAPYSPMIAQSVLTGLVGGNALSLVGHQLPLGPFVGPCDIGWMGRVTATTGSIAAEFEIFLVQE